MKLNRSESVALTLGTNAERELIRRAHPLGGKLRSRLLDYHDALIAPRTVAKTRPNTFGLYDMCENVHEWCSDWYGADYYRVSPDRNPQGPPAGTRRTSRGGSWRHQIKFTRCAARSSIPPEFRYADYGFRIAVTV